MASEKSAKKDKNQNIQVFVRLRPLNQRERDIKSLGVIDVVNCREVVVKQHSSHSKKFTFDRAFGPNAKQIEIYQDVVSPLIEEVLAGYNCTVFAYGQTGTGKTHTMVGENTGEGTTWQDDPLAGIIPRALSQLFDELRISDTEYTVRVSYLELYNEELFDLLSTSEDNTKLRIYEDVTRKGSNIVNGLEEITVYNKNEVYKIMSQGQERKRVASTLMNAQSSRSHTVFTIVVHMKENSPEGEELVKIGKLNLVDLAGSENISKAGSDNPAKRERARECVNINQSLLTLGRVITALVERHPHIPYRESKLTRILQESLGGRTKTSIIATISPGHKDLEETMSTLEYAHRAKNIQNKPEINQKMTKKAILKEYAEEIDRLKRDLQAARDKNGVYLATETYTELTLKQEEQRKEIQDLLLRKRALEEERDKLDGIFSDLNSKLQQKENQLHMTMRNLEVTKETLKSTSDILQTTKEHYEEQKHLVDKQAETESALSAQAQQILHTAHTVTEHVDTLHDTLEKRRMIESTNLEITKFFLNQSEQERQNISHFLSAFIQHLNGTVHNLQTDSTAVQDDSMKRFGDNRKAVKELLLDIAGNVDELQNQTAQTHETLKTLTSSKQEEIKSFAQEHSVTFEQIMNNLVDGLDSAVNKATVKDTEGRERVAEFVKEWCNNSSALTRALYTKWDKYKQSSRQRIGESRRNAVHRRLNRAEGTNARGEWSNMECEENKEQLVRIENRYNRQKNDLETERSEAVQRLQKFVEEEERRIQKFLEEKHKRLEQHVEQEEKILEERVRRKMEIIEEERREMEELVSRKMMCIDKLKTWNEEDRAYDEQLFTELEEQAQRVIHDINQCGDELEEGTEDLTTVLTSFNGEMMQTLSKHSEDVMMSLHQAKHDVESGIKEAVSVDQHAISQFSTQASDMLDQIVDTSKKTMDKFVENVQTTNQSTVNKLTTIDNTCATLATEQSSHFKRMHSSCDQLSQSTEKLRVGFEEMLAKLAQLEGRYLSQEYCVYSPSGRTPVRQEYRFPRNLAATSPHERILERFRARKRNCTYDDCIVIEDNESNGRTDSESSLSEESAYFATPITDYNCTTQPQQQGKENADRTVTSSVKKPSRLPAPSKRPLQERNDS